MVALLTSSKPNRNCHPESLHGPSLWWSQVTCHMWSEKQPRNSIMVSLLKRNRCKAPDTWVAFIHSTWPCSIEHHLDLNLLNLHPCYLQVSSRNHIFRSSSFFLGVLVPPRLKFVKTHADPVYPPRLQSFMGSRLPSEFWSALAPLYTQTSTLTAILTCPECDSGSKQDPNRATLWPPPSISTSGRT